MASTTAHTIVLFSNNDENRMQRVHSAPCQSAVTVTPGHLLDFGTGVTVKPHATADGASNGRRVALENPWSDHALLVSTNGPNIDHAYLAGETVFFIPASNGDVLYMFIAAGQNAAKGAPLVSNGDGTLKVATVGAGTLTDAIVGYATEAVDNSGGGAAVRIRVRAA
jgi:hypothetical protein